MRYSFFTGADATAAARWVADRIPGCGTAWDNCVTLIVSDGAYILGGVVFHDYQPSAGVICLSAAGSTGWLTRRTIRETHEYAFAHCQMVVWQTRKDNDAINTVARGLGYTPHEIPRLAGRDQAAILWTLTDDDWQRSRFSQPKSCRS